MTQTSLLAYVPLMAALLANACAHASSGGQVTKAGRLDSSMRLLPRAAYLVALDSALVHIRRGATTVWVDGPEPFPLWTEDLIDRQARRGDGDATCPGEASITFMPPSSQPDGSIRLGVIEETPVPPGLSLEHAYDFACEQDSCRLRHAWQVPGDRIRTCGPGARWSSPVIPPAGRSHSGRRHRQQHWGFPMDADVPPAMPQSCAATARQAGDTVEYRELAGAGHMELIDPVSETPRLIVRVMGLT